MTNPAPDPVRDQYEAYPYPPRRPEDEAQRLIQTISGSLLVINHHCFAGRRDFRRDFRALVAGGGTGDTLIYLAEQLRDSDADLVYLDPSRASRAVAEARARARNLTNITWVTGSLLDLPSLGLGQFDYVDCCGVLHHLPDPESGLAALDAVLRDDGALFLMLYGRYGRQTVYELQALLRALIPAGLGLAERVRWAREVLAALPASNRFARDRHLWESELNPDGLGDAGLYDLLLHSQDRCYDVPGLYDLAAGAGLHLLSYAVRADAYDPLNHLIDPVLRTRVASLDLPAREALGEQLVGDLRKHEFFLARQPARGASLRDENLALRSFGTLLHNARRIAADMVPGRTLRYADGEQTLPIRCTPVAQLVYAHMDGRSSIREIRRLALATIPGLTPADLDAEIAGIYGQLHPRGYLYLMSPGASLPDYSTLS